MQEPAYAFGVQCILEYFNLSQKLFTNTKMKSDLYYQNE